jgi:hypothetical protein
MTTNRTSQPVREPDLRSYRAIHEALRSANEQLVVGLRSLPEAPATRVPALRRWFAGYRAELRTHHELEDEVFFPALAERVPSFERYAAELDRDHHRLDELIQLVQAALDHAASGGLEGDAPAAVDGTAHAIELRDLMAAHLDVEDDEILPMFERHFTADEYEVLDRRALESVSLRQAMFTVPWFMATAAPEEAAHTFADAPLAMKVVHALTRRRYARLAVQAFGPDGAARRAEGVRS